MQDGEHLMMASLEWDDDKQLSLNDVAITECVGFTFLKSSNLAVSLHLSFNLLYNAVFVPAANEILNLIVFGMDI